MGDVLDAPGARAEGEQVADPRLVDHLLVELADPSAGALTGGEEHGVQPAVGDRAAGGDGEPLGAAAAGEGVGEAVPGDAGAQLGELVAGVAAREHVEHRLEHRPGERGVGGGAAGEGEHVVDGPLVERAHRHDLLGEHVERGVGQVQRLDLAGEHALDDDGGLHEVAAELGEQHPAADRTDLVAGAADALQPGGDRRRGLDLHDEVDGAHVDAELEAARGDDGRQPAGLEVLLDGGALLLAHRPVVGPGEHGRGAARRARLGHDLGRAAGERGGTRHGIRRTDRVGTLGRLDALLPDLVEPGGEALGEPAAVGEDEGRGVLGDEVDDALLDVRPDGGPLLRPGRRAGQVAGGLAELGHVGHGDDDLEVPLLGRRRLHDVDRATAGEVAGDLLDRSHGRGQPDPLRRAREQGVEPLEAERQVRAALGAGEGVHLVDDDRLDPGQRLARGRGEDEEQRLGGRDEHVGRRARERAALVGRGVTRAHRHGDVGLGHPEPGGRVPDADQGAAQVALDVDGQRLHRGDVEHAAPRLLLRGEGLGGEPVERPEEGRQGLARAGRRDDQGVVPAADRLPGAHLGRGGRAEAPPEPRGGGGGEAVEDVAGHVGASLSPATDTEVRPRPQARGCCWVMQWMPPPRANSGRASTPTTRRPAYARSSTASESASCGSS